MSRLFSSLFPAGMHGYSDLGFLLLLCPLAAAVISASGKARARAAALLRAIACASGFAVAWGCALEFLARSSSSLTVFTAAEIPIAGSWTITPSLILDPFSALVGTALFVAMTARSILDVMRGKRADSSGHERLELPWLLFVPAAAAVYSGDAIQTAAPLGLAACLLGATTATRNNEKPTFLTIPAVAAAVLPALIGVPLVARLVGTSNATILSSADVLSFLDNARVFGLSASAFAATWLVGLVGFMFAATTHFRRSNGVADSVFTALPTACIAAAFIIKLGPLMLSAWRSALPVGEVSAAAAAAAAGVIMVAAVVQGRRAKPARNAEPAEPVPAPAPRPYETGEPARAAPFPSPVPDSENRTFRIQFEPYLVHLIIAAALLLFALSLLGTFLAGGATQ